MIDGSQAGFSARGLEVDSGGSGSTIQGLDIVNFDSGGPPFVFTGAGPDGIYLNGATNVTITGNYIGVDASGSTAEPNGDGISIFGLSPVIASVGGTITVSGNLISGNADYGIFLPPGLPLNTVVTGNLIGTDKTGNASLGNGAGGVYSNSTSTITIGGTTTAARNVISGSVQAAGVSIQSGSALIENNYIGTNASGTAALSNGMGLALFSTTAGTPSTVGGTQVAAGNLISGNTLTGVDLGEGDNTAVLQGNDIGTDATGTKAVGNGTGVMIVGGQGPTSITIGGTTAGTQNVISGNTQSGILTSDAGNQADPRQAHLGADAVEV